MQNDCNMIELPFAEVANLIRDIKQGKIDGSHNLATKTLALFKEMITKSQWKTAEDLMKIIRNQALIIVSALPTETLAANMARRVLKLIREEYDLLQARDDDTQASLHKLVTQTNENEPVRDYSKPQEGLRAALLDHLQEIETELETSAENLSAQAAEHIHSNELILTLGYSRTVENFLKRAAKERKFEVVVAECAPACKGHALAASLANAKIETTVISDAAIFAMMSRVNKVIIGTHSVLANGGLRGACGSLTVALAAKHYSVPVIVLVPMYKLSPVHLCGDERDAFNLVGNTEGVLPYNSKISKFVKAYSPVFDYVPSDLVTLFISNGGGNAPSYVYRLLRELYHPDDYDFLYKNVFLKLLKASGHALAASLANAKIEATVISDAAIFAMMSRVNKVIIGTHSVLANGGLRGACGSLTVALAAKHYSVPVIVLVPMYKLSPVHLCGDERDAFNLVGNTEGVLPYNSKISKFVKAYSPVFDYVPSDLVTLFISNGGGNAPSYVYRLLSELYHPDDYDF